MYSTNGGTSWSTSPTVPSSGAMLVRVYYTNDTTSAISGARLTTSLPSGFSLVTGSTRVCLNPSTSTPTNPNSSELVCNTDAAQSGAIDEGAVWSGSVLSISPTVGVFGQPIGDTSGVLAMGKTRYVNLEQCAYFGFNDTLTHFLTEHPYRAVPYRHERRQHAVATATCGPGGFGFAQQAANTATVAMDLLGQRYVNLEQCVYDNGVDLYTNLLPNTANTQFNTGTNTSNNAATSPT